METIYVVLFYNNVEERFSDSNFSLIVRELRCYYWFQINRKTNGYCDKPILDYRLWDTCRVRLGRSKCFQPRKGDTIFTRYLYKVAVNLQRTFDICFNPNKDDLSSPSNIFKYMSVADPEI